VTELSAPVVGFQGSPEQRHFDQIDKDPKWGWDKADTKSPVE
jgi:hypothetical protein